MESPWLHRYAIPPAVCALFPVVAVASVTSGQVMPQMLIDDHDSATAVAAVTS
jgi:hypothetical protein